MLSQQQKTPEKAIPAGGLSIKCGGWVKEAKLLLDVWPREMFPGEKKKKLKKVGLFILEETPG